MSVDQTVTQDARVQDAKALVLTLASTWASAVQTDGWNSTNERAAYEAMADAIDDALISAVADAVKRNRQCYRDWGTDNVGERICPDDDLCPACADQAAEEQRT